MTDIFQIASVGMQDGKQRLEAISMNAASASLPGYRRQVVTASTFDAALAAADVGAPDGSALTALDATVFTASRLPISRQVDLKPGAMIATGRSLDVAIDAEDLFFALTDGTQTWLTRGGSFHVNEDGLLVGERGLKVIGTQGDVRLPSADVLRRCSCSGRAIELRWCRLPGPCWRQQLACSPPRRA
jgi:flagellar basal-body rod protein FlgF